jgi:hypothetical protein
LAVLDIIQQYSDEETDKNRMGHFHYHRHLSTDRVRQLAHHYDAGKILIFSAKEPK